MFLILKKSQLRVFSSLLVNISAGLLLGTVAIRDIWVLFGNIIFAIICLVLSIKLEDQIR